MASYETDSVSAEQTESLVLSVETFLARQALSDESEDFSAEGGADYAVRELDGHRVEDYRLRQRRTVPPVLGRITTQRAMPFGLGLRQPLPPFAA